MAESQTLPKLATPAFIMAGEQFQRQQLAQEVADRAKDPLSEAKRPGGFFLQADGTPVDANGTEIKDLSDDESSAVKAHRGIVEDGAKAKASADKAAATAQANADARAEAERQQVMAEQAKAKARR